jgi:anaerobic dimethyl sulfoxide reductase subunit B (iron-sulfur subunit)
MKMRYGFYIDTSSCTGCKACQIACKDKNNVSVGILWRRVVEVNGGKWFQRGDAWLTNVFAYFVSSACMHCEEPICVEVCPTAALFQRDDGIVLIEEERCIGCRYCEMACPYKAPQFDSDLKVMTKCNFCYDLLEQNLPPACVAACQMRVLHFGNIDELRADHGHIDNIFPLPDADLTKPAVVIKLHPESNLEVHPDPKIGNLEEI